MNETIKLTLTLTLFCLIAGGLLAAADALTRERIMEANRAGRQKALNAVLPPHNNAADADTLTVVCDAKNWTFFIARQDGAFVGTAVETSSPNGYGGEIRLILGIGADGKTIGISVLAHKETPGLGAIIETPKFQRRLAGQDIQKTNWHVKKDGGDIDQITAATISSRAVVDAIREALNAFSANRQQIEIGGN